MKYMDQSTKQLVLGSLLGDAYISRCYDKRADKHHHEFRVEHSIVQEPYILWKYARLASLSPLKPSYRDRESYIKGRPIRSTCVTLIVCGEDTWKPYRDMFYDENGRKRVTEDIMSRLTPEAVAVWYMDDGFYHVFRNVACLATYSFTLGEHHLMADHLRRITGATASIVAKKPSNYYYLYFPRDEARKFLYSLDRHIPDETGMRYKIPVGWDKAVKLTREDRQCMPARIPEADARMLIVNNLKWFAAHNDVSRGFPVVLYCYTKESYSFKAIHRVFGSFEAALAAADLPTKFV